MRGRLSHIVFAALLVAVAPWGARAQLLPSLGGDRAGTSGFQFLKIPVDARGASLGETAVVTTRDASALFWNPALVSHLEGLHVGLYQASYFVDVNMAFAAVSYSVPSTDLTIGASVHALDSGDMEVTTEFQPFGTGQQFALTDIAAGLTLSQRLTDLFSYGVTVKYVTERVAELTNSTIVFDMGVFYRVGDTGASMGVSLRNFGLDGRPEGSLERTVVGTPPVRTETSFERMTPPTTFLLGFAYEFLRTRRDARLLLSAQLNNPNDNAESWNVGAEYVWRDLLSLRTGYRLGIDEVKTPSLGVGINVPVLDLRFDYGFNHYERLGSAHRIGVNLGL